MSNISLFCCCKWAIANICYQGLKACVNKCPAALICWAPIVLGCRPQWQLHQATSCFWCMRPREHESFRSLKLFSSSCHPQWRLHQVTWSCKSAHVSGCAWVLQSFTYSHVRISMLTCLNILMLENLLMILLPKFMTALRLFWSSWFQHRIHT